MRNLEVVTDRPYMVLLVKVQLLVNSVKVIRNYTPAAEVVAS